MSIDSSSQHSSCYEQNNQSELDQYLFNNFSTLGLPTDKSFRQRLVTEKKKTTPNEFSADLQVLRNKSKYSE